MKQRSSGPRFWGSPQGGEVLCMCGSVGGRTFQKPAAHAAVLAWQVARGLSPERLALLGEDRVDLAAGLVEQLADPFLLAVVGGVEDLADRVVQLGDAVAEVDRLRRGPGADGVPRGLLAGLGLLLGGAGPGQGEAALAAALLAPA